MSCAVLEAPRALVPAIDAAPEDHPFRLRPAPPSEPPQDEWARRQGSCSGQLEMLPSHWTRVPSVPASPDTRPVPALAPPATHTVVAVVAAGPAGTGVPHASRLAAHCFVAACVEVINGFRPIAHLRPLTGRAAFAEVVEQLGRRVPALRGGAMPAAGASRVGGAGGVARTGGVARAGGDVRNGRVVAPPPTRLRHLRVGAPRPDVVECAAVLGCDQRAWALAVRLERRAGGWTCADIQVL